MNRLAVYPGDLTPSGWETAKLGHGLGLLPDAIQPRIRKTINGDWCLTLRYPLHGRGAELLRPDRLILAQGQLWRVLRLAREDGGGIRALSVEAPHLAYDLRDSVIEKLKGHPLFAHVTLTRSERSPIAALVTELLEGVGS